MTCAKRKVVCTIITADGRDSVTASNHCMSPQPACPRAPNEDYKKCKTICHQTGHAEANAVVRALERGLKLEGATAIVRGIDWVCKECGDLLRMCGVRMVIIDMENGSEESSCHSGQN